MTALHRFTKLPTCGHGRPFKLGEPVVGKRVSYLFGAG
jgi:hypothetical protein|tara:strand:+ start:356 stop:469 length:114 start_codon:yes stop_codon:yes gene_type:complete